MINTWTIASGKGGVGKSTLAAALAVALVRAGQKVVLVDMDIGLRSLDIHLGMENSVVYDVLDYVRGDCKLIQAVLSAPDDAGAWASARRAARLDRRSGRGTPAQDFTQAVQAFRLCARGRARGAVARLGHDPSQRGKRAAGGNARRRIHPRRGTRNRPVPRHGKASADAHRQPRRSRSWCAAATCILRRPSPIRWTCRCWATYPRISRCFARCTTTAP